jgi:hypothetical protein
MAQIFIFCILHQTLLGQLHEEQLGGWGGGGKGVVETGNTYKILGGK